MPWYGMGSMFLKEIGPIDLTATWSWFQSAYHHEPPEHAKKQYKASSFRSLGSSIQRYLQKKEKIFLLVQIFIF